MPQLPSDRDLGMVPADASGRIASAPNAGAVGEAITQLGGAAVQAGATVADVRDEYAMSHAYASVYQAKVALDQKYRNDPDPATAATRYAAELQAAANGAAQNISQPRNQMQFNDMVSRFVIGRGVDAIQFRADSQLQDQGVADAETAVTNTLDAAGRDGDPVAAQGGIIAARRIIESSPWLSPTQKFTMSRTLVGNFALDAVKNMSPEDALKFLGGAQQAPAAGPPAAVTDGNVLSGELHLDPSIAPKVPPGAARPFAPGEAIKNPDGSWSSEISVTVTNPILNAGKPTVIPSLWLVDGNAVQVNEDTAARYAVQSGLKFQSFDTMAAAEKFATDRETKWQGLDTSSAKQVAPLWETSGTTGVQPQVGQTLSYNQRVQAVENPSGDPNVVNFKSGAAGTYQFTKDTWRQYGSGSITDRAAQEAAMNKLTAANRSVLTNMLGRGPTDSELYLAHQQGAQGAESLLTSPNESALGVLTGVYSGNAKRASQAIINNGGNIDMTAGQFASMQMAKFDATGPGGSIGPAGPQGATVPPPPSQPITGPDQTPPPTSWPKNGTLRDFIPGEELTALYAQKQTEYIAQMERIVTLHERQMALADKQMKDGQAQALTGLVSNFLQTRQPIDDKTMSELVNGNVVSLEGMNFYNAVVAGKKNQDDPQAIFTLSQNMANHTLTPDQVFTAFHNGDISDATAVGYAKALADPKSAAVTDPVERGYYSTLKALVAPSADTGFDLFQGEARNKAALRWANADAEWTQRVLAGGEDPRKVLLDMAKRYNAPIAANIPQPKLGAVRSPEDLAKIAQATVAAHTAKTMSDAEYATQVQILSSYHNLYISMGLQKGAQDTVNAIVKGGDNQQ